MGTIFCIIFYVFYLPQKIWKFIFGFRLQEYTDTVIWKETFADYFRLGKNFEMSFASVLALFWTAILNEVRCQKSEMKIKNIWKSLNNIEMSNFDLI